MGDRTSCHLRIWGEVSQDAWDKIEPEICSDFTFDTGSYSFYEVNYGNLDRDLAKALMEAGLSYIWDYDAGCEYNAGTEMYDAENRDFIDLPRHEDSLFVPAHNLDDPAHIRTVQWWQKFRDGAREKELVIKQANQDRNQEDEDRPVYLIRKRGLYYRPNSQGYTNSVIQAGRYTLEEAKQITHPNGLYGPRDGMTYLHEDEKTGDEDWVAYRVLLDRVQRLEEALAPIVEQYKKGLEGFTPDWEKRQPEDHILFGWNNAHFRVGMFSKAAAVLATAQGNQK